MVVVQLSTSKYVVHHHVVAVLQTGIALVKITLAKQESRLTSHRFSFAARISMTFVLATTNNNFCDFQTQQSQLASLFTTSK